MKDNVVECGRCGQCCVDNIIICGQRPDDSNLKLYELRGCDVKETNGVWWIRMPCACKEYDPNTKSCKIYDTRPEACRKYPSNDTPIFTVPDTCSFKKDYLARLEHKRRGWR